MIPKVIVIILLTTAVVTSMELHPVNQCPNDKEWSERAHKVCGNNEYRYHCMFAVNCTSLVESCIEPRSGSYAETEYGVYFLTYNNKTGSPEFYKQKPFTIPLVYNLMTNSSSYWEFLNIAYCQKLKDNQTQISCESSPGNYNVVLAMAIAGWVLAICILVVCVFVSILFYKEYSKNRKKASKSPKGEADKFMPETKV